MNKKEEIKYLKLELKKYKAQAYTSTHALEPYKKLATQRGARMQLLMKQLKRSSIFIPQEFYNWFDRDGGIL